MSKFKFINDEAFNVLDTTSPGFDGQVFEISKDKKTLTLTISGTTLALSNGGYINVQTLRNNNHASLDIHSEGHKRFCK